MVYKATLAATGGTAPYSGWSTGGGALPDGLTLSSTGVLGGTPTIAGTFNFSVAVSDHAGSTASAPFQLVIAPGKLAITTTSPLPGGQVNAAYSQVFQAAGGTPPYVAWTTSSGTLPPGLILSAAGLLTGVPTTLGAYNFTLQVTDSAGATATTAYALTVTPAALVIATGSPLPGGQANVNYSQSLVASGGSPPYTWSASSASLPAGLTLSSAGVLSGIPTLWGTYGFVVQVTDHASVSASAPFQITIAPGTLAMTTTSPLPPGLVGSNYSQSMTATGGKAPYTWAADSRAPGLSFSSTGQWSGTAASAGIFSFTIQVADSNGARATGLFVLTISPTTPVTITTASPLPSGNVNSSYSQPIVASFGTPPYTNWTVISGSLPPGLTLNSAGILTGTPASSGTYNFKVQVTDTAGVTASAQFQLSVNGAKLAIATPSPLPSGQVNSSYSQALSATGGTPPYTWASFSVIPGLTLSSTGVLSGIPTTPGTNSITVQVTDSASANASAVFQLTINPPATTIVTASLPAGQVGIAYSQALSATGGTPPYANWSMSNGALPPGLSLSTAGVLGGMPTTPGTYGFNIQVTDKSGAIASAPFQLVINPAALAITTASVLPPGKVNASYSLSLAASGGTPPYANWSISSGAVAPGLALSSSGMVSGTPTSAGSYTFTIHLTDNAGGSASASFQLTISPAALAISTVSPLPAGKVNLAYWQTFAAGGGAPPYSNWSSSGGMPAGLTLSSAGVLSGTPASPGTYTFPVQVSDSAGTVASTSFQLTIGAATLTITTSSPLAAGQIETSYSATLTASGGSPPYTAWNTTGGSLPSGLTLSGSGVLSGTPTTPGTYSFTVQVTDKAGATASTSFQLLITSAALTITTLSPLPAGKVNTPYSDTLSASGGTQPYAWTTTNGTLPAGLSLNSAATLSGTSVTAGNYSFTVQVTDKAGATASTSYQLTINPAALAITTTSPLPAGRVSSAYSSALAATGGTPPYSWMANGGAPGLTLSSSGVWSGMPTAAGSYNFTVQVNDSSGAFTSGSLQLTINPAVLSLTTASPLPAGKVNTSYSQSMTATGGTPPYTWTASGAVPGLALSSTGSWSGTPTAAGTYSFTIQVTDSAGASASMSFQLTVSAAVLAITTASPLPEGKVNAVYSQSTTATGGTPPYTWNANGGAPGLTLSPAGAWSGTPTTPGTYSFTMQVIDSAGATASMSFQLTVIPATLTITTASPLPSGHTNSAYSQSLSATGGMPPYTWSASGGAPGLTLSTAGAWFGTPTTPGTYSFTVQVSDTAGAFASAPFQLTINQPSPAIMAAVSSASPVGGLPVTTGSWVAVYGTNLAPTGDSRLWNSSTEIVNGKLPASLDGTSVTVNGKPATVEYISPGQVNIQMPDDTVTGPVPVVVTTTAAGASNSFMVNYAQFSPGFFPATAPYIVAQHADNSYVTASSPALPGEVIVLWGGGMGPASPAVPSGQVFSGANPLANNVTLTIGGQPAAVVFAGVVGAGLVQINAQVPAGIGGGDQAIVATVGGVSSPSGAYISVGTSSGAASQ